MSRILTSLSVGALLWTLGLALLPSSARALTAEVLIDPVGEVSGDRFGGGAAIAGDFNGDGYDDVIFGAEYNDHNGFRAGRAYLYFCGPQADTTADLVFTGTQFDRFGRSVASAGDVNGDGFDDVIVGAWFSDLTAGGSGAAYVYFGGVSPDTTADMVLAGQAANEHLGISVACAGDVNGDGYDDIIVGAYAASGGNGRAYLYFGGASPDTTADLVFIGEAAGDQFGWSTASAGDFNGDGFDDVIVGAYGAAGGGDNRGKIYLYFGGSVPDTTADITVDGNDPNEAFGYVVSSAGDLDGNGYDEVIIGAHSNDDAGIDAGRAYVLLGGAFPDAAIDWALAGENPGDTFGLHVGWTDANGDGYSDVLIGAPLNDDAGADAGKVYVYFGGPGIDSVPDLTLTGEAAGASFGSVVGGAGDIDGDGIGDFVVGAYLHGGTGKGYAYTPYPFRVTYPNGGETWLIGDDETIQWKGADLADLRISYDGGSSWDIVAVSRGGLAMNTYSLPVPSTATNQALVRVSYAGEPLSATNGDVSDGPFQIVDPYMPPGSDCDPWWSAHGEDFGDGFGRALGSAGDVNQDGYGDVLVGAPWNAAGGPEAGRAYLYFGGDFSDTTADLTLTGEAAGDRLGHAVGAAGDFNNDGYADLIVGAYRNDAGGSAAGRAYLYLGGMTPDAVPDAIFTGPAALRNLGWSVGTAGDVNGDGYDDVILGAVGDSSDTNQPGWAYLYFGGAVPDTTPDLVFTGEAMGDRFGWSVGTAGDVNGDGYDDVLVGAVHAGSDHGRVYVFHGGPGLDAVPDLVLTGEAVGDLFGISAATGGDVNDDGYSDVIVGASGSDAMGTDGGRAYLYLGGPAIDDVPEVVYTSPLFNANFGRSVASVGDPNEDGYSDLIVGAPLAGTQDVGHVYVFYGGPSPDNGPDLEWYGIVANAHYGFAVATGGDMTGDGITDVLIGRGALSGASLWDCGPDPVGIMDVSAGGANRVTLAAVSPNPMWSGQSLQAVFTLPAGDTVVASLFDLQGRRIASSRPQQFAEAGEHRIRWNPGSLPAGVYFLQLRTASGERTSRNLCVLK